VHDDDDDDDDDNNNNNILTKYLQKKDKVGGVLVTKLMVFQLLPI